MSNWVYLKETMFWFRKSLFCFHCESAVSKQLLLLPTPLLPAPGGGARGARRPLPSLLSGPGSSHTRSLLLPWQSCSGWQAGGAQCLLLARGPRAAPLRHVRAVVQLGLPHRVSFRSRFLARKTRVLPSLAFGIWEIVVVCGRALFRGVFVFVFVLFSL